MKTFYINVCCIKTLITMVQTRSETKYQSNALFEVNINFDEASSLWKQNKKSIGNGSYKYVCCAQTKTGKNCNKTCIIGSDFCKMHCTTQIINK